MKHPSIFCLQKREREAFDLLPFLHASIVLSVNQPILWLSCLEHRPFCGTPPSLLLAPLLQVLLAVHLEALLVAEAELGLGLGVGEEGGPLPGQARVEQQDLGAAGHLLQGAAHAGELVQEPEE